MKATELKKLRKSLELSQAAFAKKVGISPVTISMYETGKHKISEKMENRIKASAWSDSEPAKKKKVKKEKEVISNNSFTNADKILELLADQEVELESQIEQLELTRTYLHNKIEDLTSFFNKIDG